MLNIRPELLDELLQEYRNPEDLIGESGILKQLTKALVERCLDGEITHQLQQQSALAAQDPTAPAPKNRRNGYSQKTMQGSFGSSEIRVPRDRQGIYEPILVEKHQTRFTGFDDKIIALYARGMSTRDIEMMLQELYGVQVSAGLISQVTQSVEEERKAWQCRTLDEVYPIVFLDALVVKVRQEGRVVNKAIYLALGLNLSGEKELLGLWMSEHESSKFWLSILTELNTRGVKDIFIACCDGLSGFPQAIEAVFPKTRVQLCLVHMVRHSLSYVSAKDRKAVAGDLKCIYGAQTETEAELALAQFAETWDKRYPTISKSWRTHWQQIIPFFAFPYDIRKVIYTTNAIESVNMCLRKVLRNHRVFPTDEAALKVVYLAIHNLEQRWTRPIADWKKALNRFAIEFEGRLPM